MTPVSPGGEPLWSVSGHPRSLRLNVGPAETCENKRLPRTSKSVATPWVIRGSRLLKTRLVHTERRKEILCGGLRRAKAAPLQGLGSKDIIRGLEPFETYAISISRP